MHKYSSKFGHYTQSSVLHFTQIFITVLYSLSTKILSCNESECQYPSCMPSLLSDLSFPLTRYAFKNNIHQAYIEQHSAAQYYRDAKWALLPERPGNQAHKGLSFLSSPAVCTPPEKHPHALIFVISFKGSIVSSCLII